MSLYIYIFVKHFKMANIKKKLNVNHQLMEIQVSIGLRGEGGDIYQSHTRFQTTKHTIFHLSPTSALSKFINIYGEKTLSQLLTRWLLQYL